MKPGAGDETAFLVTLLLGVALPQAARRPWHQHLAGLVPPYPVPFTALGEDRGAQRVPEWACAVTLPSCAEKLQT